MLLTQLQNIHSKIATTKTKSNKPLNKNNAKKKTPWKSEKEGKLNMTIHMGNILKLTTLAIGSRVP